MEQTNGSRTYSVNEWKLSCFRLTAELATSFYLNSAWIKNSAHAATPKKTLYTQINCTRTNKQGKRTNRRTRVCRAIEGHNKDCRTNESASLSAKMNRVQQTIEKKNTNQRTNTLAWNNERRHARTMKDWLTDWINKTTMDAHDRWKWLI